MAEDLAERMRKLVAEHQFPIKGNSNNHRTISIGVACLPDHGESSLDVLEKADVAMYAAKDAGRNCVRLAGCRELVGKDRYQ